MERYNWSAIAEEKMNPLLSRRVIHTGQMTIARLWLGKGLWCRCTTTSISR